MITNTVIVFLRDLLPIFVLFSYLSVIHRLKSPTAYYWIKSLILGIALTFILFISAEFVTDWFDGAGLEIMQVLLIIFSFIAFLSIKYNVCAHHTSTTVLSYISLAGVGVFVALKGAEFSIFFNVYKQQHAQLTNIVIGCILGFGICISFAALLRFFLTEIFQSSYQKMFWLGWYAFLAGHVCQSLALLSQVDIINAGAPLLDLNNFIKDSSEYGHILHALLGYESSPTSRFIVLYFLAFITPIALDIITKFAQKSDCAKAVNHE